MNEYTYWVINEHALCVSDGKVYHVMQAFGMQARFPPFGYCYPKTMIETIRPATPNDFVYFRILQHDSV